MLSLGTPIIKSKTPQKTHIAPENRPLEAWRFLLETIIFRDQPLVFGGSIHFQPPRQLLARSTRDNKHESTSETYQLGEGFEKFHYHYLDDDYPLPVVPGQAGGGSFQKEKNYIAKKEFAYRMCARRPTSAMPKSFLCLCSPSAVPWW